MKSSTVILLVFLSLTLLFSVFYACRKADATSAQQQLQWLNYTGKNEFLKGIISQLKSPALSANLVSECATCSPDWDNCTRVGIMGDTLSAVLVPVVNNSGIVNEYIKISTGKNNRVKSVHVFDYKMDYANNKDLSTKARAGMDLQALYLRKNKLPSGFSPDSAKILSAQAFYSAVHPRLQKGRTTVGKKTNASTNAAADLSCDNPVTIYYSMNPADPSLCMAGTDDVNQAFLRNLGYELDLVAGGDDTQYYLGSITNYDILTGTVDIQCSSTIENDIQGAIDRAFTDTRDQDYPDCVLSLVNIDNQSSCSTSCCISDLNAQVASAAVSETESDVCGLVGTDPSGKPTKTCTHQWVFNRNTLLSYAWSYSSIDTTNNVQVGGAWTFNAAKHLSVVTEGTIPPCVNFNCTMNSAVGSISSDKKEARMDLNYTVDFKVNCCPWCNPSYTTYTSSSQWPVQ